MDTQKEAEHLAKLSAMGISAFNDFKVMKKKQVLDIDEALSVYRLKIERHDAASDAKKVAFKEMESACSVLAEVAGVKCLNALEEFLRVYNLLRPLIPVSCSCELHQTEG